MPDYTSVRTPRERDLDALIAEYYEAVELGRPLDQADYLRQHPEFSAELRDFFADVGQIEQIAPPAGPAQEDTRSVSGSTPMSLSPGMRVRYFGDYEMLEELGAGGMGVVYKARQTKLKKIVALKMIKVGHLASDSEVRRFQAEAQAAAKLDHSGIVPVHEVGVHRGQHYYTMDFVRGGSLSQLHRDEPVASRRAAELVQQLSEAMHYAHGQGIVHRDLKPANVLLTTTGAPRITDFGLAKRMWSADDTAGVSMTETGQVLGTAGYMSPEQAAGKTRLVAQPADIYALGAVLYALLTSRAPFVGESQADTILQVIHNEPVSPRVLNPSVPRDLETICLKCLEKETHRRYGTAQLLADDLTRFLGGRPVLARPVGQLAHGWRWCARNPGLAALTALSVALLITVAIVSTVGYLVAVQERSIASMESAGARQNYQLARSAVDSFLVKITDDPGLRSRGLEPLRHKLLLAARGFYERMASGKSDDPLLKSDRAEAYMKLGTIARELGNINDSTDHFSHALALYRELSLQASGKIEHQSSIAHCLLAVGMQHEAKGELQQALRHYQDAKAILEPLHRRDPQSPESRNDYARVLHSLGILHRTSGELVTSKEHFEMALAVRTPLLTQKQNPQYEAILLDQLTTLNGCGAVLIDLDHFDDATAMFRQSISIREDLAKRHPAAQALQAELAEANANLASTYVNSGHAEKAEPYFQSVLAIQEQMERIHPDVPRYKLSVAFTRMNLGIMYRELGRIAEAKVALEAAAEAGHGLLQEHEAAFQYKQMTATCHYNLGAIYHKSQDFSLAVKHRKSVIEILESLFAGLALANPELKHVASELNTLDNHRGELCDSLHALALRHILRGQNDEAANVAGEAVEKLTYLSGKHPDNRQVLSVEAESRLILAVALARLNKHQAAAREVTAALATGLYSANIVYNGACVLALISTGFKEDPKRQELYSQQAVALLAKGFNEGLLSRAEANQIKGDKDLAPIFDREDFQKLLREHLRPDVR